MDLTASIIFASIFVLASISLFLVYKFGIKKKSYEEALAEHRKQTSTLLATKPKPKEKKSKKAVKKNNKEKISPTNSQENEMTDNVESGNSKDTSEKVKSIQEPIKADLKSTDVTLPKQSKQSHVEFKGQPEEVPVDVSVEKEVKEVINKKRVKKVRPILVKKIIEQEKNLPVETPITNHFEEIHPKDEFELMRSHSQKNVNKPESLNEEKKPEKSLKKNRIAKQEAQQVERNSSPLEPKPIEKEKPREEKVIENVVFTLSQEAVINTAKEKKKKKSEYNSRQQIIAERDQLIYSVRNAELSRTEVQLLIDLLLNKQLEAPAVINDWSEGKFDPVQKLKKQLAEKEKLLADAQQTLAGVQAKLREVRNEQLTERAQMLQKIKNIEESKAEINATNSRFQSKIQELEDFRNKELANFQRIVEDNKALQMQRGQLEAALINYQETDTLIHNLKTDNAHLNNELQRLTQELQEQATNYQNFVIQNQTLQEELRSKNEHFINMEKNHRFAITAQLEEKRSLTDELERLTNKFHNEEQRLMDIIGQLKAENKKLHEENSSQMNGSEDENKAHEIKLLNLTNELSSLKSQLLSVNEKLHKAERQYQNELEVSNEKYKILVAELEKQKNKNNRVTLEIKEKEQAAHKDFLQRLFPEIESLGSVTTDNWQEEFGCHIRQYISQLQQEKTAPPSIESTEMGKLQTEILHYKKIIDETEGILKRLQSHIEQEERNWRNEVTRKDAEIEELKKNLQVKLSSLESQLAQEQTEKQRLLVEHHQLVNKLKVKGDHADSTATIERLSEEINRLKEQLRITQTGNSNANIYQNGKTS